MIKRLFISLACVLASWSSTEACSIMPPNVATESTYEQNLEPYFTNLHRKMVDQAEYIVVGKFKYSENKKRHLLNITENLKRPKSLWPSKKVYVSFDQIDDDRIEYEKRHPELVFDEFILDWFWPLNYPHGIEGSYGPGDCRLSLNIISDAEYLVFANKEFKISSMLLLRQSKAPYKTAIENLIENPLDKYGISFSVQQMLDRGSNVQLLKTSQCLPKPVYTITKSSKPDNEGKTFNSQPIKIFEEAEERYGHELTASDNNRAATKGLAKGLYTNAPSMKECRVGQNYLMMGQFLYSRTEGYSGQMIVEDNGYFQLDQTVYEHHISPQLISYDAVADILSNQSTK